MLNIFLIEDDFITRESLKYLLSKKGYNIFVFENVDLAATQLDTVNVDIVILDNSFDDINKGKEFINKACNMYPNLKLIITFIISYHSLIGDILDTHEVFFFRKTFYATRVNRYYSKI